MTRRAPGTFGRRRTVNTLALAVSLWLCPFGWSARASAAPTTTASPGQTELPVTGSSSRTVVRVGSVLFAAGSIVTYIAAGIRRRPVRPLPLTGDDDEPA